MKQRNFEEALRPTPSTACLEKERIRQKF